MARATERMCEPISVSPGGVTVYVQALAALTAASVPFLVGGAWAMANVAGVRRHTKDIDLFVRPSDLDRVLATLEDAGFRTEVCSRVWLAKAWLDEHFVDIVFSSGNGLATVDDLWFTHALPGEMLDLPVLFCPVEETVWSKAWIMERERYDGADVAHLLLACGATLDWPRLLTRFAEHWRLLYTHLVLFRYLYPGERSAIPSWVMEELGARAATEDNAPALTTRLCRGPLVSRQFAHDLDELGYAGPRTPRAHARRRCG